MKLARRLTWAALGAGVLLRVARWGSVPITNDDGYMLRTYANESFSFILTHYWTTNHVLLSLLLHAIDAVWPKKLIMTLANPWPLQLPSLAAAGASLWLMADLAAALAGPAAALFSVVFLALSYWHLMYSTMLRGYSLSVAFELAALWLALKGLRERRRAPFLWAALAAAAAHATLPTNAAYTLALGLSLLWLIKRNVRRRVRAQRGATSRSDPGRAVIRGVGIAVVACVVLTLAFYGPVLGQIASIRSSLPGASTISECFAAEVDVLGFSRGWALGFAALAAAGLLSAARRRSRRSRGAAFLIAAYLVLPPLVLGAGKLPGLTRAFLPGLPFACLAAGLALREACAGRRLAVPFLALAAAAVFSTQAAPYWRWNRGVEPGPALARVAALERDADDFITIVTERGDDRRFGEINWDYYGMAASLEPYWRLTADRELPYQSHERYLVLAEDETRARRALAESGVDGVMLAGVKLVERSGRLAIYETRRDEAALSRYRALARGSAEASTQLGADALTRGDYAAAVAPLERAKALAPGDERARFQLARAYYLTFDDRRAAAELAWVVARDTTNVHAPLMLGGCLADLGRFEEAKPWFEWYFAPERPAQAWIYKDMARAALAAGGGRVAVRAGGDAAAWLKLAEVENSRADYARAAAAIERARRLAAIDRPWVWRLASIRASMHDYARAAALFREALAAGDDQGLRVPLARVLRNQNDFDGAREQLERFRAINPRDPYFQALDAELRRL